MCIRDRDKKERVFLQQDLDTKVSMLLAAVVSGESWFHSLMVLLALWLCRIPCYAIVWAKGKSYFTVCLLCFCCSSPQKKTSGNHHGSCIVCVCSPCVSLKWFCCCLLLPRPYSPFQAGQGGGFSSVQLYAQCVSVGLPWHFSKLLWDVNRKEENKLITTVQQRDKKKSKHVYASNS